jgi:hypothetical protein
VNLPGASTSRPVPEITFGSFDNYMNNKETPDEMSLAAKAREAEYNAAAAARLRARHMEGPSPCGPSSMGSSSGPSSMRPISLSAFTKPNTVTRNKGHKGWKPLTAEDMEEELATPARRGGVDQSVSPRGGSVPSPNDDKGKGNEPLSRLTPAMLPRIRTNLSPYASGTRVPAQMHPAGPSSGYNAGYNTGYGASRGPADRSQGSGDRPDQLRWMQSIKLDAETGTLVTGFIQAPAFLNAVPAANFHEGHSHFPSQPFSDFLPSPFITAGGQGQTGFGGHQNYSSFYHQEPTDQFVGNLVGGPFMGTPPYQAGRWAYNSYLQDYVGGHQHDGHDHGCQFPSPSGMTMDSQYHHQSHQQVDNEAPVPARSLQAGQRPQSDRPAQISSRVGNVTSVGGNPVYFDRNRVYADLDRSASDFDIPMPRKSFLMIDESTNTMPHQSNF